MQKLLIYSYTEKKISIFFAKSSEIKVAKSGQNSQKGCKKLLHDQLL